MHSRLIWASASDIAIVEDDWRAIPHAWLRLGPPSAISIRSAHRSHLAVYTRLRAQTEPVALIPPTEEPLVQCLFRSRHLGELRWVSDENPRDLACIIDECGPPRALLLVQHGQVTDRIQASRRRPSPLVRLLALEPHGVLTI